MNRLEDFAKNGNPLYPNTGRDAIIGATKIGTSKYTYSGPYKNPDITQDPSSQYSVNHTNAKADATTPFNGKGTADGVVGGNYSAAENYLGGSTEDINGVPSQAGSGRNQALTNNNATWGFGPTTLGYQTYKDQAPTLQAGGGQVIIV